MKPVNSSYLTISSSGKRWSRSFVSRELTVCTRRVAWLTTIDLVTVITRRHIAHLTRGTHSPSSRLASFAVSHVTIYDARGGDSWWEGRGEMGVVVYE